MVHRIDSLHAGHLSVFSLQRSHKYRWLHGRVTMFRRLVKQFKHFELRYNNLVSCRNDSSFVSSTLSTFLRCQGENRLCDLQSYNQFAPFNYRLPLRRLRRRRRGWRMWTSLPSHSCGNIKTGWRRSTI